MLEVGSGNAEVGRWLKEDEKVRNWKWEVGMRSSEKKLRMRKGEKLMVTNYLLLENKE